ncbi:hypothetical protein [Ligilactobacillus agilis]|uniref:hypothetical protein n=1 Tax=Ligilactobacillus agilis TaxID=1601 RepID=UPI000B8D2560|nr:hypothetical protein [Ligilactobacillus agilis]ASR40299.1 hypothetical protein BEN83_01675 [Ligilactobacillus agilis]
MIKLYLLYSRYLTEENINHEYLMIITSSKQQLNQQIKNLFTKNPDEKLRLEVWNIQTMSIFKYYLKT